MKLNAYLSFPGTAEEAFEHYRSVLGGEITALMRYRGTPGEEMVGPDWRDKVMHACLHVGGMDLMASDMPPEDAVERGGYHVSVQIDDPAEAERIFKGLAEGGTATMPMDQTFWARRFGMLTDRFGINWIVNCE